MDRVNPDIPSWGFARSAKTGAYTVVLADRGYTFDCTANSFTVDFTSAATLGAGFVVGVYNSGSGTITLDPASTETIRTPSGAVSTLALTQGLGVLLLSDGTNWEVVANSGLAGTADVTLAPIGSSPNANAATLTGQVLNLEPASGSFGGVVTTGTQTMAGAKTFSTSISTPSITDTGLTASRLVRTNGSQVLESNAALTNTYVLYADSNGWPTGSASLTWSGTLLAITGTITITGGTVTASTPPLSATQTWNNAGVAFIGYSLNATDSASAASSALFRLQTSSTTKFNVNKTGTTAITKDNFGSSLSTLTDAALYFENGGTQSLFVFSFSGTPVGGVRGDSSGNFNLHATGTQGHQFYKSLDTSLPVASIGGNGVKVGGAAGAVATTAAMELPASTTSVASLNLPHGSAPSSPVDGDMWTTTAGLFVRINGSTIGPLS